MRSIEAHMRPESKGEGTTALVRERRLGGEVGRSSPRARASSPSPAPRTDRLPRTRYRAGVPPLTPNEVMPLLLGACPSCVRAPELKGLLYVELGAFARHLVSLLHSGATNEFVPVFAVVESLHVEGDPEVQEAATIGLLEGIQNVASNGDLEAERFAPWLGPESRRWWRGLEAFWSGRAPRVQPVDAP